MVITVPLGFSGADDRAGTHAGMRGGPAGGGPGPPRGLRALLSLKAAGDLRHEPAGPLPERLRLFARLGIDPARVYACRQVHSRRVVVVTGGAPADFAGLEADGLVTCAPGAWLAVTVADCLPIWLADRRGGRLRSAGAGRGGRARALLHSGWQGTGIVREAVRLLRDELGVPPGALAATIGPGIGPCCYAVPRERFEAFRAEFGPQAVVEVPGESDPRLRWRLDLRAANLLLLEQEGVRDVRVVADCTACNPRLSSYRRDGAEGCGRMLALVGPGAGNEGEE